MRNYILLFNLLFCFGLSAQNTPQPSILNDIYPASLFNANFGNELFRNRFCKVLTGADTVVWFVDVFGKRALMKMGASGGGGSENIYNTDGTLTSDRVLSGMVDLSFLGLKNFNLETEFGVSLTALNDLFTISAGTDFVVNTPGGNTQVNASAIDLTAAANINIIGPSGIQGTATVGEVNFTGLNCTFNATGNASANMTLSAQGECTFIDNGTVKQGIEYGADYGTDIRANARSIPDVANTNILIRDSLNVHTQSGRYTPIVSSSLNTDIAVTVQQAQFSRTNKVVTVSGTFTADPTTNALATGFKITLPVVSNLGANEDCAGVGFCGQIVGMGCAVTGSAVDDRAQFSWIANDITSKTWSYTFTYEVL